MSLLQTARLHVFALLHITGRSDLVVSASDCGVREPRFESHLGRWCLSWWLQWYTALGTGCAPLMQYLDSHFNYLLSQCAQRIYILKLLRHQGMSSDQIITVAYALILSRIMYALRAWGGFLSAALIDKINAFLSALLFTYIFTYIKGLLLSAPCLISRD